MTRKLAVLGGAALASLLVFGLWDTAEARRGGGGGGYSRGGGGGHHMGRSHSFRSGSHHFRGGGHHFRGGGHSRHRHLYLYGAPFAYGYYSYSDGCHWMRQRALFTGSSYWWNRYYACLYGEGYYNDYD